MAANKKLNQLKREYFESELGVSSLSLYDLEKKYYNDVLGFSGNYLNDLRRQHLQSVTGLSTSNLQTLWLKHFSDQNVPAGSFNQRLKYFYENTGFNSLFDLLLESGDRMLLESGDSILIEHT